MNDFTNKAKRTAGNMGNKARDVKDDAQQKLDDMMPGTNNNRSSNNRRRNKR